MTSLEIVVKREQALKREVCETIETLLNKTHISRQSECGYRVKYNQEKELVEIRHDNFKKVLEINVHMDSVSSLALDVMKWVLEHKLFEREDYFFD